MVPYRIGTFDAFQNLIGEHSIASLYNLTKSVPDALDILLNRGVPSR